MQQDSEDIQAASLRDRAVAEFGGLGRQFNEWDRGPWVWGKAKRGFYVESRDFTHDVRLYIDGDFADGEQWQYAQALAQLLNRESRDAQPIAAGDNAGE